MNRERFFVEQEFSEIKGPFFHSALLIVSYLRDKS